LRAFWPSRNGHNASRNSGADAENLDHLSEQP
jgi:hypothetical protein